MMCHYANVQYRATATHTNTMINLVCSIHIFKGVIGVVITVVKKI